MKLRHLLALWLPVAACHSEPLPDETAFRGEWRTERLADFVHRDGDAILIGKVVIGGVGDGTNFANRGDVIVTYDLPGSIEIRTRPFVSAQDEDAARQEYDRLKLWLYDEGVGSPEAPAQMDPEARCDSGAWREGCGIRVYYDGATQRLSAGMDLHVRLPPDFAGKVEITTEDLLSTTYDNRGDVCIAGLAGSAAVELEDGIVEVTTSPMLNNAPQCPAADVAACQTWSTPWASDCPCFAKGYTLGQLGIEAGTADITVDIPADFWAMITAANRAAQPHECRVDVTVPGAQVLDAAHGTYEVARPPGAAPFGYAISAFSDDCQPVHYSDHPDALPQQARRGDIQVCTGCVQNTTCEDFLSGSLAPTGR